jgi:hypothetical protein
MADAAPGPIPGVDPVVDGIAIEDGSVLTGNVWKTLEAEGASLGLPNLKVQPLVEFLQAAELQKMTPEEKRIILDQAVLLFDHLYPHLTFKKQLFGDFTDPGENLAAISAQLDTLGEMDFHSRVSAAFAMVLDPHTWYGLPAPWRSAVAFLPFQLGFWMDRERNTHFVVTAVMNATANGGLGHPFFRPGAEILRWNDNDIQSQLSRQAMERLPVPWGEAKLTHWISPATVVPLRFCLPPDDPAATLHYIPPEGGETRAIRFAWGSGESIWREKPRNPNKSSHRPSAKCFLSSRRTAKGLAIIRTVVEATKFGCATLTGPMPRRLHLWKQPSQPRRDGPPMALKSRLIPTPAACFKSMWSGPRVESRGN